MAATSTRSAQRLVCDGCGSAIAAGATHGHGLYLEVRGDRVTREEPPLCEQCALSIGVTFLVRLAAEEEEG